MFRVPIRGLQSGCSFASSIRIQFLFAAAVVAVFSTSLSWQGLSARMDEYLLIFPTNSFVDGGQMNFMKPDKQLFKALLVLFLALATCGSALAQATGGLVGTVTDKGGAVVPDAKITLTNMATNEMKVAQSDERGNYRFVQLLPGKYKIAVEKQGFQQFVMPSVQIRVGETATADASMQVGATTETVEVTTETPLLSTQSSSLNYGVESQAGAAVAAQRPQRA